MTLHRMTSPHRGIYSPPHSALLARDAADYLALHIRDWLLEELSTSPLSFASRHMELLFPRGR
jgi:hypothetical protein